MRAISVLALLGLWTIGGCSTNERPDFSELPPEKPAMSVAQESPQPTSDGPTASSKAEIAPSPAPPVEGWSVGNAPAVRAGAMEVHVVREGDTLYRIAKQRGVTLAMLYSANGLMNDRLTPGQHILIPHRAEPPQ